MNFNRRLKIVAPLTVVLMLVLVGTFWLRGSKSTQVKISADTNPSNVSTVNTCGMDISVVMDVSGSIDGDELILMKNAIKSFVDSFLPSTPTEFSLVTFSSTATIKQIFSSDPAVIKTAIDAVTTGGGTNWEDGFAKAQATFGGDRPNKGNLILFASDGLPNNSVTIENKTINTGGLDWDIYTAKTIHDSIEAGGTRVIGLDIAADATALNNFKTVFGPNVSPTPVAMGTTTEIITTNFGAMGASLASLYSAMCGSSILVQNQIDTNGDGIAEIDEETASPLLSDFGFSISGPTSAQSLTDQTGTLQFSTLANGSYSITETPSTDYTLSSIHCTQNGVETGDVDVGSNSVGGVSITQGDNAYCVFVNKFSDPLVVVTPKIGLQVSVSPTGVPIGGGQITFSYVVTNPSSVALTDVGLTDKQCSPVTYVSGDTSGDRILQNGESWRYTCTRTTTVALTSEAVVTGFYNGVAVTAPGTASVSIIPAGPPQTGR